MSTVLAHSLSKQNAMQRKTSKDIYLLKIMHVLYGYACCIPMLRARIDSNKKTEVKTKSSNQILFLFFILLSVCRFFAFFFTLSPWRWIIVTEFVGCLSEICNPLSRLHHHIVAMKQKALVRFYLFIYSIFFLSIRWFNLFLH